MKKFEDLSIANTKTKNQFWNVILLKQIFLALISSLISIALLFGGLNNVPNVLVSEYSDSLLNTINLFMIRLTHHVKYIDCYINGL
jgi:hypothetical protein